MNLTPKTLNALVSLVTPEVQAENEALKARIRTLENRVRQVVKQRDNAGGRVKEMRAHVARYQADLAEARTTIKGLRLEVERLLHAKIAGQKGTVK